MVVLVFFLSRLGGRGEGGGGEEGRYRAGEEDGVVVVVNDCVGDVLGESPSASDGNFHGFWSRSFS